MKNKAVRIYGVNDLRLEEFELPELGEDGVRWKPGQADQYLNYRDKIRK